MLQIIRADKYADSIASADGAPALSHRGRTRTANLFDNGAQETV